MTVKKSSIPYAVYSLVKQPWVYRELLWQLTKREVVGRYRGSMMGLLWSFLNPIFMLTVYTFFFSVVYKARGGLSNASQFDFAISLFVGLIPFTLFSECVNRAPQLIINNANYVKKVIFPLDILPWVSLGSALFHMLVSLSVLLLFFVIINHTLHWTTLFLPLVNLPLFFFTLGFSWFLASLGVFLRDVAHTIGIFTTALLFLSPVFYAVSAVPEPYCSYMYFNPLTVIIEQNRTILIAGQLPHWHSLGASLLASILVASLGYYWFEKTRPAFADVV
jgi:lipopolysaccharide transport system permease protein